MTTFSLATAVFGLLAAAAGGAAIAWAVADLTITHRWRRRAYQQHARAVRAEARAKAAEQQLAAARRRRPSPRPQLDIIPGLFDAADHALDREAPTVLLRALNPTARSLLRTLNRRGGAR